MLKLITKRGSHIRSQIVCGARVLFAPHYNFNRTSGTPAVIRKNRQLSEKLVTKSAFHHKDINITDEGFGGNKILTDLRLATVFENKHALGVVFASRFTPYPLPMLALEFTALEFCANEYSTGKFVAAQFYEKDVLKIYTKHMNAINTWNNLNLEVTANIRCKWFLRGTRALGLGTSSDDQGMDAKQEEALRNELEGRTGETDSEPEPDAEDDL
ncbi:hypothetical protein B0H12DRAFT_1149635 [Mycena haematopus]|nr:hypothetical protein B0H12DRAFT_1149635 [Mycena haematopus]